MDASFLYDEDVTGEEYVAGMQELINNGQAWQMEGSVGRTAMDLIEQGACMLGEESHRNAYGGYVPSRTEVKAGTKGSAEYVKKYQE